ncbi:MAG: hypothetical protein ACYSW6_09355 [Planctomycetota bacterium]|jgi:hypothetical protein
MSMHDKEISNEILLLNGVTFASCIMAAITLADTDNTKLLVNGFPDTAKEAYIRRNAPGGCATLQEWSRVYSDDNPPQYVIERYASLNEKAEDWLYAVRIGRYV